VLPHEGVRQHDPDAGKAPSGSYAAAWIKERELTATTWQLYGSLLRHHLEPTFGAVNVAEISPPLVRRWRAQRATVERDRLIADAVSGLVDKGGRRRGTARKSKIKSRRGTRGTRRTEHGPRTRSGPGGGMIL
jgi:hypothetical protein